MFGFVITQLFSYKDNGEKLIKRKFERSIWLEQDENNLPKEFNKKGKIQNFFEHFLKSGGK